MAWSKELTVTKMMSIFLVVFLSSIFLSPWDTIQLAEATNYNVVGFGARGDGNTDSTSAFLRAWRAACYSATPAVVYAPRGRFLLKSVEFSGPCRSKIEFRIDGTLVTPPDNQQNGLGEFWIKFYKLSGFTLYGGTIDARRSGFRQCGNENVNNCPLGTKSIMILWSENVLVRGLTSLNSRSIHIAVGYCKKVRIENVKIRAPVGSPNTDGIIVRSSTGVTIVKSAIGTGDDCISIGPGSSNVFVSKISCGPGHGISIGSLGNSYYEDGVQNVTVTNSVFTKTQNGLRIKTWARPSTSFLRKVLFRNIVMRNVINPILIDQNYCPHNNCPRQGSGVRISDITYKKIRGTSASAMAVRLQCSPTTPCRGIKMQDVKLTFLNPLKLPAGAYCENAHGTHAGLVVPQSCL